MEQKRKRIRKKTLKQRVLFLNYLYNYKTVPRVEAMLRYEYVKIHEEKPSMRTEERRGKNVDVFVYPPSFFPIMDKIIKREFKPYTFDDFNKMISKKKNFI